MKKSNTNKNVILRIVSAFIITIIGVAYAFYAYQRVGGQNEIVTGQIYMNYVENNQITLTNAFPETKEEAFEKTTNIINFKINGKNTSNEDIYYSINIIEGDPIDGKERIKSEDIKIYLECDGKVLVDGVQYSDWNNRRIWVEMIPAGTTTETVKNYTLRIWVDENVKISDTDSTADYTAEIWNKSYTSLKIDVEGKTEPMNITGE